MSPQVIMGMVIMCLLAYAVFLKTEGNTKAGLEVIRLMICVAILHPPKINSTRIFVCMMLFLFLNINTLFQSHLLVWLTVPIYHRDIDTLESLKVIINPHSTCLFLHPLMLIENIIFLLIFDQYNLKENTIIFSSKKIIFLSFVRLRQSILKK